MIIYLLSLFYEIPTRSLTGRRFVLGRFKGGGRYRCEGRGYCERERGFRFRKVSTYVFNSLREAKRWYRRSTAHPSSSPPTQTRLYQHNGPFAPRANCTIRVSKYSEHKFKRHTMIMTRFKIRPSGGGHIGVSEDLVGGWIKVPILSL